MSIPRSTGYVRAIVRYLANHTVCTQSVYVGTDIEQAEVAIEQFFQRILL